MSALVLSEIPDSDTSTAVAADQLSLVRVDDYIIDWTSMRVIPLYGSGPCIPDLDCSILRACYHPFAFQMKRDACDISMMAFEYHTRTGRARSYIVELYVFVSSCGKEAFVGRNAEAVNLRLGMLNGAGANP